MTTASQDNDIENENTTAISVRHVEKQVWLDFRKMAMLRDLSLPDYLKYLVEKEKQNVQISIKPE
jgi:hypothetical protein